MSRNRPFQLLWIGGAVSQRGGALASLLGGAGALVVVGGLLLLTAVLAAAGPVRHFTGEPAPAP